MMSHNLPNSPLYLPTYGSAPVWSDVVLESSPISHKNCPISKHCSFYTNHDNFQISPKISRYFGLFCEEISKIAQPGHTAVHAELEWKNECF